MSKSELRAFHNDPLIKEKYINRLKDHYKADEIKKGRHWENGKGGAVGCTIHSRNHCNYEIELGIPEILANIEDEIFGWLPNVLAEEFPLQFLSAINVGADLSKVWNYFAIWLLTDAEFGVMQCAKNKKAIQEVADAYQEDITTPISKERWKKLKVAAYADYDAHAAAAPNYAACSAAYAAAADYAAYSAYVAAAESAAASIVKATYSAAKATATYSGKSWYIAASEKLIELLKELP